MSVRGLSFGGVSRVFLNVSAQRQEVKFYRQNSWMLCRDSDTAEHLHLGSVFLRLPEPLNSWLLITRGGEKCVSSSQQPVSRSSNCWAKISIKVQSTGLFRAFPSLVTHKLIQWSVPELDADNLLLPIPSDRAWGPLSSRIRYLHLLSLQHLPTSSIPTWHI